MSNLNGGGDMFNPAFFLSQQLHPQQQGVAASSSASSSTSMNPRSSAEGGPSGVSGEENDAEMDMMDDEGLDEDVDVDEDDLDGDDDEDENGEGLPTRRRKKLKKDIENEKREKTLADILLMMDDHAPLIPDAVTDYYLERSGFQTDDIRLKRLIALTAQKFISDVATDAFHYCKIRQQNGQKDKKGLRRNILTIDDLSGALAEHGINVKKPEYFT
ncbi:Transcription initiation factor TFIID subunit 10 [Blyttiomyces sp. JEL0837]|nr:Transcription initiation factor TFIID subunit 10 [Blyttiomyces sp. JEL0837]